jgi:hypothetical protein
MLAGIGVGLLYGVSALASKGLSGVVGGGHAPTHLVVGLLGSPYLYLLFACSAIAMLLYQAALQACRASVLIPVSNVVSSGFFVIVGTWLFHEQLPASPVKLGLRLAGIAAAGVVLVILGIQSRGAEVVDPETELADLEIPAGTLAMAGRATGPQPAALRRTGPQPVLDRITGPQPLAMLRRTGPQPVLDRITGPQPLAMLRRTGPQSAGARLTGPQLVGAPVAAPESAGTYTPDPEPGQPVRPERGWRTDRATGLRTEPEPGHRTDPGSGWPTGPQPVRQSGPQPATVRTAGSRTAGSHTTGSHTTGSHTTGSHTTVSMSLDSQPAGSRTPAVEPAGGQTWLSQATTRWLRVGRPRGRHEKSRTGRTGVISRD